MRYYDIKITEPGTDKLIRQYTSFPNGVNDPGALNVLVDAYVYPFAIPAAQAVIQIWGISLQDISQASNFTNNNISVYGGFQKGLPLNNPAQARLLFTGIIFQSFANWQGTDMTLDFVVYYNGAAASQDNNIVLDWKAGTSLATALANTMKTAFPKLKQTINVNPKLILSHDEQGAYSSLQALAQVLKPLTQELIGGTYPGVDVSMTADGIIIYDGSTQSTPTPIAFQDLIGQPTWLNNQTLFFMCPMRGDLSVGMYITMPKGLLGNSNAPFGAPGAVTTTPASQPQTRQQSAFSGTFLISLVHHMGNSRQPDGQSWSTVFNAVLQPAQT